MLRGRGSISLCPKKRSRGLCALLPAHLGSAHPPAITRWAAAGRILVGYWWEAWLSGHLSPVLSVATSAS